MSGSPASPRPLVPPSLHPFLPGTPSYPITLLPTMILLIFVLLFSLSLAEDVCTPDCTQDALPFSLRKSCQIYTFLGGQCGIGKAVCATPFSFCSKQGRCQCLPGFRASRDAAQCLLNQPSKPEVGLCTVPYDFVLPEPERPTLRFRNDRPPEIITREYTPKGSPPSLWDELSLIGPSKICVNDNLITLPTSGFRTMQKLIGTSKCPGTQFCYVMENRIDDKILNRDFPRKTGYGVCRDYTCPVGKPHPKFRDCASCPYHEGYFCHTEIYPNAYTLFNERIRGVLRQSLRRLDGVCCPRLCSGPEEADKNNGKEEIGWSVADGRCYRNSRIGESCLRHAQCSSERCEEGICECPIGYRRSGYSTSCVAERISRGRAALHESCRVSEDCGPAGSGCLFAKCSCLCGFRESTGACVRGVARIRRVPKAPTRKRPPPKKKTKTPRKTSKKPAKKTACARNLHPLCSFWAGQGECVRNPAYMTLHCEEACVCNPP